MADPEGVLVLVPGSFCPADVHYSHLIPLFTSRGYSLVLAALPTTTKKPGSPPTMYDDAVHINAVVGKLADEGKEIVLVAHSYGGTPVSEALKGLSKAVRERNGKKGGVVRVGYVTALVPALGQGASSVMRDGLSGYTSMDADGWLYHPDLARMASLCYSDLSLDKGITFARKFTQHTAVSFVNKLTYAGYRDVPVSWLFTEKDQTVLPHMQQTGIDNIEKASERKVDITRIPNDHMPHVSAPQKLVDWMVSLVEQSSPEA